MVIGFQIRKLHRGAESAPPPAVLDSKKPGLFRVKENNIPFFTTNSELKESVLVERFNPTLKSRMWKYFMAKNNRISYMGIIILIIKA